jgi:hypothetical protein
MKFPAEEFVLRCRCVIMSLEETDMFLLFLMLSDGCSGVSNILFNMATQSLTFRQDFPLGGLGASLLRHKITKLVE